MDRSVLLVLWCLQAFLLITSFTSTDAAALVTDDHQQQSIDLVRNVLMELSQRTMDSHCVFLLECLGVNVKHVAEKERFK